MVRYNFPKYEIELEIDKDVYFPAEDTFLFLDSIRFDNRIHHVIEIGGGSGIISIFLARNYPNVRFLVSDIVYETTRTIMKNTELNKVEEQIDIVCMDKLESVRQMRSDIIIWNPPYLPIDSESEELKNHEKLMMIGGNKGYEEAYHLMKYLKQIRMQTVFYTIFSSLGWDPNLSSDLKREGIIVEIINEIGLFFEKLYLIKVRFCD